MSLAGANDTRFRNKMRIPRKIGSSVDGCRRARNSLGQLGKILGKNRNWPSVLCGKCGNRKICPRFHIGGESSGANGCNFPQMPRLPHSKTCSVGLCNTHTAARTLHRLLMYPAACLRFVAAIARRNAEFNDDASGPTAAHKE